MKKISIDEAIKYLENLQARYSQVAGVPVIPDNAFNALVRDSIANIWGQSPTVDIINLGVKTVVEAKISRRLYKILKSNFECEGWLGHLTLPELIERGLTIAAIKSFRGAGARTLYELTTWAASDNITIPPY